MEKLAPIVINPKTFLREHCSLPALPKVVEEIQEILQSDSVDIGSVSKLISTEPALVAQILKVVNSAYYSLPREVSEVRHAIAFLGLHEVSRLVLALSVVNTIGIKDRSDLDDFWFHSFYASLCTKHLAKKYEPRLSFEELWSASILHDIGKLVYLKFFPDHYHALRSYCAENGCLFSDAEEALSLISSTSLGALLCDHWRLPAKIKDACEHHSLGHLLKIKSKSASDGFKRMICLGNLTAILAANQLNDGKKREIASTITESLQCSDSDFLTIMAEIYDLKAEVERFIAQFS